jgi:hypothetical protein
MTKFKIGDVVRLKADEPYKVPLIVKEFLSDSVRCKSECGRRCAWAAIADLELIERRDPQADIKKAIREVLLSDEFMTAFAAAFLSATVPRSTFEHPIPGVNRPMRNEAQLSKMVEVVRQSLTTEANSPEIPDGSNSSEIPNSSSEPWVPKAGDTVWVLCHLKEVFPDRACKVEGSQGASFWTAIDACRPVEPPVIKESLTTESNSLKILDSSSEPIPKPSKTQPPSDYRMLESANDEPRSEGDQYWSLSAKDWSPLLKYQVDDANRDNWAACRKIEVTSSPPKRYRDPTKDDLKNGPIACEYRDCDDEQWRSGFLVYVLNWDQPFLCVNKERGIGMAYQWEQCRIEVTG